MPLLKKFRENTSGNFGSMFAILALPVITVTGSAVDLMRISNAGAKLQASVESGVLSAASLSGQDSVQSAVNEYVMANIGDDPMIQNVKIKILKKDISLDMRQVAVKAEADVPLSFLKLIGQKTKKIEASAEAIEARHTMELSMVLDISSSMAGKRLTNLKTAASEFVDQMLPPEKAKDTSINLVPFGGTVNIGDIFDTYAIEKSKAKWDPDAKDYSKGYNITNQKFRFSNGDNCVELRKEDFDLKKIQDNSRPQVPHFWKYRNFNPWCPESQSAALWNTNKADDLKKRINEMTLSDGTGMDHGLLWGAKALSPEFRGKLGGEFKDRPKDFASDTEYTQKIMVLMTDGGITFQGRPKDYKLESVHTNKKNNKNQQTLLSRGNLKDLPGKNTAIGNYKAVCDDLKSKGVTIYTIGFQIKEGSLPENLLQYCASNPANYFHVETLDIGKAFNAIAAAVQKLRVTG